MKNEKFCDTQKSGFCYVLLKHLRKKEGKMKKFNSAVNLRKEIENTMVDLIAHMDAYVAIVKNLEEESVEKDPLLLQNIRSQLMMLKTELRGTKKLNSQDVLAIAESYNQNIKILISEAKDYNLKALDKFVEDVQKAIKTCERLITQSKQSENGGLMNEAILVEYVTKIKTCLDEQLQKLEEHRPLMYPSVPDPKEFIDGNKFKKDDYIVSLDNLIIKMDERLSYLSAKQQEFAQAKLAEEKNKQKLATMPINKSISSETYSDGLEKDEEQNRKKIQPKPKPKPKPDATSKRKPPGLNFIN
ncbi:hypothetical protein O3M35_012877 [Rhynocoris fuscipes]|uniref:Uncharacterized protein n=1 Tax=Rhynocoris fuscipes TaxID=488301 RepID=A0AAW1CHG3_9HEMI